jgi:pimeloyl-ACP methyl ester carboxylesterase
VRCGAFRLFDHLDSKWSISMPRVTSKDGTSIAYDRSGEGPAVILVDGALCFRAFGPMGALAALLAPHCTVCAYDRRGRGESGDTAPYAVEREVEDIEALIDAAGGSAGLYGISSGAFLALEAAHQLPAKITKLALYEPPCSLDEAGIRRWMAYRTQLDQLLAAGRRGDAVTLFMRHVGAGLASDESSAPQDAGAQLRQSPIWPIFEAVAPTLAYDSAVMGDSSVSAEQVAAVDRPAARARRRGKSRMDAAGCTSHCRRRSQCAVRHPGGADARGRFGGSRARADRVLHRSVRST